MSPEVAAVVQEFSWWHNATVRVMLVLTVVLLLLSSTVTALLLYNRFAATNANRESNKRVWHAVICTIETQTLLSKHASPAAKATAVEFYDGLLVSDVHTTGCGFSIH